MLTPTAQRLVSGLSPSKASPASPAAAVAALHDAMDAARQQPVEARLAHALELATRASKWGISHADAALNVATRQTSSPASPAGVRGAKAKKVLYAASVPGLSSTPPQPVGSASADLPQSPSRPRGAPDAASPARPAVDTKAPRRQRSARHRRGSSAGGGSITGGGNGNSGGGGSPRSRRGSVTDSRVQALQQQHGGRRRIESFSSTGASVDGDDDGSATTSDPSSMPARIARLHRHARRLRHHRMVMARTERDRAALTDAALASNARQQRRRGGGNTRTGDSGAAGGPATVTKREIPAATSKFIAQADVAARSVRPIARGQQTAGNLPPADQAAPRSAPGGGDSTPAQMVMVHAPSRLQKFLRHPGVAAALSQVHKRATEARCRVRLRIGLQRQQPRPQGDGGGHGSRGGLKLVVVAEPGAADAASANDDPAVRRWFDSIAEDVQRAVATALREAQDQARPRASGNGNSGGNTGDKAPTNNIDGSHPAPATNARSFDTAMATFHGGRAALHAEDNTSDDGAAAGNAAQWSTSLRGSKAHGSTRAGRRSSTVGLSRVRPSWGAGNGGSSSRSPSQAGSGARSRHAALKTMFAPGESALDATSGGGGPHQWSHMHRAAGSSSTGDSGTQGRGAATSGDSGAAAGSVARTRSSRYLQPTEASAAKAATSPTKRHTSRQDKSGPPSAAHDDPARRERAAKLLRASSRRTAEAMAAKEERSAKLQARPGVVAPARNVPGVWTGGARDRASSRGGLAVRVRSGSSARTGGGTVLGEGSSPSPLSVGGRSRSGSSGLGGGQHLSPVTSPSPLRKTAPGSFSSRLRAGNSSRSLLAAAPESLGWDGSGDVDSDPSADLTATASAARQALAELIAAAQSVRRPWCRMWGTSGACVLRTHPHAVRAASMSRTCPMQCLPVSCSAGSSARQIEAMRKER